MLHRSSLKGAVGFAVGLRKHTSRICDDALVRRWKSTKTNASGEAVLSLLAVKTLIEWFILVDFVKGCVYRDDDGCIVRVTRMMLLSGARHQPEQIRQAKLSFLTVVKMHTE
jgi:hypothetical protein